MCQIHSPWTSVRLVVELQLRIHRMDPPSTSQVPTIKAAVRPQRVQVATHSRQERQVQQQAQELLQQQIPMLAAHRPNLNSSQILSKQRLLKCSSNNNTWRSSRWLLQHRCRWEVVTVNNHNTTNNTKVGSLALLHQWVINMARISSSHSRIK